MLARRTVKRRGDHFAINRALHIGDFFRALVDKNNHEVALLIIRRDGVSDVLQNRRFTGLRRGHDQRALPLTDRHDEVDHTGRELLLVRLQPQPLVRVQRCELGELGAGLGLLRRHAVDRVNARQGGELLPVAAATMLRAAGAVLTDLNLPGHSVATTHALGPNHVHGHIHIVGAGLIPRRANERGVVVDNIKDARDRLEGFPFAQLVRVLVVAVIPVAAVAPITAVITVVAVIATSAIVPVVAVIAVVAATPVVLVVAATATIVVVVVTEVVVIVAITVITVVIGPSMIIIVIPVIISAGVVVIRIVGRIAGR